MSLLQNTRMVLTRTAGTDERGWTAFGVFDEDADVWDDVLTIPFEAWRDMGRPDEVTITLEPGDLLN